ncbi:MAG: hypothetical protein V3T60_01925 [Candidatus Binatia bacterium]
MTISIELSHLFRGQYGVLILDNEVTVGHFAARPPLPWSRLTQPNGSYRVADGYPVPLTLEQTRIEMKIWDQVSTSGITQTLGDLRDSVDYLVIGNNAGQGFPLARCVPQGLRETSAAIIFGESLPEIREYENEGYRTFLKRKILVSHLTQLAIEASRPLALAFINTIQHDASNYHDP